VKRSLFVVLAGLTAIAGATPQHNVTGQWHGQIHFDMARVPMGKDRRQNSARIQYLQKIQQAKLSLTIKGDHTYALSVNMAGLVEKYNGRWSLNGSALTIEQMVAGRYSGTPQTYTFDKTWRSFSLVKVDNAGLNSTVSYFR